MIGGYKAAIKYQSFHLTNINICLNKHIDLGILIYVCYTTLFYNGLAV